MTEYVLAGVEYQKQYCYWDDFEKLHTIQTSPVLFCLNDDGDGEKLCVSEDLEFMQGQADRMNSGNFAEKYSQYEGASWIDWCPAPMDDFDQLDLLRGHE